MGKVPVIGRGFGKAVMFRRWLYARFPWTVGLLGLEWYRFRGHRVVMETDDGGRTWHKAEKQGY